MIFSAFYFLLLSFWSYFHSAFRSPLFLFLLFHLLLILHICNVYGSAFSFVFVKLKFGVGGYFSDFVIQPLVETEVFQDV